ncbi:MAG: hypothetical protein MR487_14075, partial [Lachnospiraceae bacterium]|nr:hypothetical protein [Lachnospiraceae bacterium]
MKKRVISLFLAVSMCIMNTAVPVQASGYTEQTAVESPDNVDVNSEDRIDNADNEEALSEGKAETELEVGTETEEETVPALNGIAKGEDGKWHYYTEGEIDTEFTGFAENENGWWYINAGDLDFSKTEVIKGTVNGETAWWNVSGGQVEFTDTVAKNANGWWCIQKGKVNFDFTGFAKNSNGWWYCKNGKVDFSRTEVIKGTVNGE